MLGNSIEVNAVLRKALPLIWVTELGIYTLDRLVQPSNAPLMLDTLAGISTEAKAVQSLNVSFSDITPMGIDTWVKPEQPTKVPLR